ncbi:MAG TPA: homoserine dehydrogenase [Chloroflexota bacterium]|nr:homoserine dehydrogenase [Chloroflexota bacterium]
MKTIQLGVLGAGTVGSGTLDLLRRQARQIAASIGCEFNVRGVAVRDLSRPRVVGPELLTNDCRKIVDDPAVEIVVELIGGETPAVDFIARALRNGKHVVTANKEVVAKHGPELLELAFANGVNLYYEASVGGGIPVISVMRHDLVANEMTRLRAIINGTTNFILTAMEEGRDYLSALGEAQRLGYAEADPRNDVEAIDAAYKLAILSTLAFRTTVHPDQVTHVGITNLRARDFAHAARMGYVIKLLASADVGPSGIEVSVRPTMLPRDHHLAAVKGVYNAVLIEGEEIDEFMLYGRGAGARPTASAVVADICAIAHNSRRGVIDGVAVGRRDRPIANFGDTTTRFYLRVQVMEQPGVLAQIAQVLAEYQISIASVMQHETDDTDRTAEVVITTHLATERRMDGALAKIRQLPVVREISGFLRMEK